MRLNSPPWREGDVIRHCIAILEVLLYFVTYPGVHLKSFFNPLLNVSYIDHEALAVCSKICDRLQKQSVQKLFSRVDISIIKACMFLFLKRYSTLSGIQTWISKIYSCVILQHFYRKELASHIGSIMPGDLAGVYSTKYKNIIIRVVGTGSKF